MKHHATILASTLLLSMMPTIALAGQCTLGKVQFFTITVPLTSNSQEEVDRNFYVNLSTQKTYMDFADWCNNQPGDGAIIIDNLCTEPVSIGNGLYQTTCSGNYQCVGSCPGTAALSTTNS